MIDISIIIPTYNNLDLFKKSLRSVINQQNVKTEVIIVDDSTNSEINDYLKKINSDKIQYYRNIPSKGAVRNWNYGLTLAKGMYVTVLHHDEYYEDSAYQLSNLLENKEEAEVMISKVKVIRSDNSWYSLSMNKYIKNFILNNFPSVLFFYNFIGPVSCVIYKNSNVFFFNKNLKWSVDVDWYYRLFKNRRIKYFDDYNIISILNHEGKITSNIDVQTEINNDYKYLVKDYIKFPMILLLIKLNFSYKKLKLKLMS